jgi:hypothetical protein
VHPPDPQADADLAQLRAVALVGHATLDYPGAVCGHVHGDGQVAVVADLGFAITLI